MMTFIRSIENSWRPLVMLGWVCAGGVGLACAGSEKAPVAFGTSVSVPPFLEFLVFDIESPRPETLSVQPPGEPEAVPLTALAGTLLSTSPTLTRLEVRRPRAGTWRFAAPGEAPKVRFRKGLSHLRGRLVEPPAGGLAGAPCRLAYEVVDLFGDPLSGPETSLLDARAWLMDADGALEALTLQRQPRLPEAVRFVASRPQFCQTPGRYRLEVDVVTRDRAGRLTVLLRDGTNGFSVPQLR